MARALLTVVLQNAAGDVQTSKALTFFEIDGTTPLAQTLYDAPSGGNIIASPTTNSLGTALLYVTTPQRAKMAISGVSGTTDVEFAPDPSEVVRTTANQTIAGIKTHADFFSVTGDGNAASTARTGLYVGNAQVGFLQQAALMRASSGALPAGYKVAIAHTTATNENPILLDLVLDHASWGQSTPYTIYTGTATSGGASTLSDSGANFGGTNNLITDYFVVTTGGTGSGQTRQITANTTTQITVSPAWSTQPDATTTYRIARQTDVAAFSSFGIARSGSISVMRGGQIHAIGDTGHNGTSLWGLELACESAVTRTNEDGNVGLYLISYWAGHGGGAGPGVRANTAIYVGGFSGWDAYLRAYNTAGTKTFEILDGGSLRSAAGATFGSTTAGTGLLNLKQTSGDSTNNGLQIARNASANMLALFMGGDNAVYFQNIQSGAETARMTLGGTAVTGPILTLLAPTGHTGHLLALNTSASGLVAYVRIDGHADFTVGGVATRTKAGVPSDADWPAGAPPVGAILLDTTNNRAYFRTAAATWKYAALT